MTHDPDELRESSANDADHATANTPDDSAVNSANEAATVPATERGEDVVDLDAVRERRTESATAAGATAGDGNPDGDGDADGGEEPAVVPVDQPAKPTVASRWAALRDAELRPVVPPWLRSVAEFRTAALWLARLAGHTLAYHVLRVPKYLLRLMARAPIGASRVVVGLVRWIFDAENEPLRQACARSEAHEEYRRLVAIRDRHVRWRGMVTAAVTPVLAATITVALWWAPASAVWSSVAALVAVLGLLGRPADQPRLLDVAVVPTVVEKLTSHVVLRAMGALGISEINRDLKDTGGKDWFKAPITRDGDGWRAVVDLPRGVTAEEVIERRNKLASGLRRPLGCVWPEGDRSVHEGRLVLWVGDRDLSKVTLPWKLAKAARHDIFRAIPFGTDPRGRAVQVPLNQHNILIGANPGQGKTSAVRVIGCGAALDPTAELWVHELLGKGDLAPLGKVAHRYVSGVDDESLAYAAESARLLRTEVERRTATLGELPDDLCPDNHVTRSIADKKSLRLHHLTAIFDEVQNLLTHPTFGPQATDDLEFVIRSGRAVGVTLVLATQRPVGNALPARIRDLASIRFCLSVEDHQANDVILGSGAYRSGLRATMFRPEIDAGIGYLKGATPTPIVVRTAYLDRATTDEICTRARSARINAGRLTGYAAGEDTTNTVSFDLLSDVLAVIPASEDKVWTETVAARLAELRPDIYTGWGVDQLNTALKAHKIPTGHQVWGRTSEGKGANRRGIVRDHIVNAVTKRDQTSKGDAAA